MNCEQVELLLPEYWSGAIAMNDHRELEKHFALCPACKLQAEQLGGVWKRLDMADMSGVAPSESLRERFYETLDAYRAGVEAGTSSEKALGVAKSTLAWWRQPWFQFATAAAMLLVGVFAGALDDRSFRLRPQALIARRGSRMLARGTVNHRP